MLGPWGGGLHIRLQGDPGLGGFSYLAEGGALSVHLICCLYGPANILILCFDMFYLHSWSGRSHEKQDLEFGSVYVSTAKSSACTWQLLGQYWVICVNTGMVTFGRRGLPSQDSGSSLP